MTTQIEQNDLFAKTAERLLNLLDVNNQTERLFKCRPKKADTKTFLLCTWAKMHFANHNLFIELQNGPSYVRHIISTCRNTTLTNIMCRCSVSFFIYLYFFYKACNCLRPKKQ